MTNNKYRPAHLTATQFVNACGCPFRLTFYRLTEPPERTPPSPLRRYAMRLGIKHEQQVIEGMTVHQVPGEKGESQTRFQATQESMSAQEPLLYHGYLIDGFSHGEPDLLQLNSQGCYEPGDIKNSRRVNSSHVLQLMFYAYLLERVTGKRPPHVFVLDAGVRRHQFATDDYWQDFQDRFDLQSQILTGNHQPIARQSRHCQGCEWRHACLDKEHRRGRLWTLWGSNPAIVKRMNEEKIDDIQQLCSSSPNAAADGLANHEEQTQELMLHVREDARATLLGHAIKRRRAPQSNAGVAVLACLQRPAENTPDCFSFIHPILGRRQGHGADLWDGLVVWLARRLKDDSLIITDTSNLASRLADSIDRLKLPGGRRLLMVVRDLRSEIRRYFAWPQPTVEWPDVFHLLARSQNERQRNATGLDKNTGDSREFSSDLSLAPVEGDRPVPDFVWDEWPSWLNIEDPYADLAKLEQARNHLVSRAEWLADVVDVMRQSTATEEHNSENNRFQGRIGD